MATAAPASPSSNVSAAEQPIDGEQTKAQGGSDDGGVGGEPGEVAPKRQQRKERLPGVMTKDDGEGIFDDLGYKNRAGKRVSRKEAQADADREMREELGIVAPPEQEKTDDPAPAPKKFKFGGKEFDSQEAAEQSHKSLEGMFKPLNERLSKAEQVAKDNADSARQWRERAMAYEAGQLQAPQPQQDREQPTTPQSAEQELQAVLSNVDGEMFETLARERGLPLAGRYLAAQVLASVHDQMLPALRESIMSEIMPQLQPMQQSAEFTQATESVTNLFENVSQLRNPDGQVAFPELNDENEAWEVAELWSSSDNPTATPQSLIQAIALYRLYRGARGGQQQSAPAVQISQPRQTAPPTQTLEQGGGVAGVTAPRAGAQTEQNRFARALDDVDLVDRTLGFAVRRRR